MEGAKMRQKPEALSDAAEKAVRDIKRATRRHFSAEDKIRIVIAGLRGEDRIAELCRKEGISQNLYYRWSKEFLEAGKKRLAPERTHIAIIAFPWIRRGDVNVEPDDFVAPVTQTRTEMPTAGA